MKKTFAYLAAAAFALAGAANSAHAAEQPELCLDDDIQMAPNPLLEVITIPFKVVVVLTYLPRCLVEKFPTND